jgi:hypothetical protein
MGIGGGRSDLAADAACAATATRSATRPQVLPGPGWSPDDAKIVLEILVAATGQKNVCVNAEWERALPGHAQWLG